MALTSVSLVTLIVATCGLLANAEPPTRVLAAATRRSTTESRRQSEAFIYGKDVQLVYANGSNAAGDGVYAATIRLTSRMPIVLLEDIEGSLSAVECTTDRLTLSRATYAAPQTLTGFESMANGHIITSHLGCNAQHERAVYKILHVTDSSDDAVTLAVTRVDWQAAFDTINIEFGRSTDSHILRVHSKVRQQLYKRETSEWKRTPQDDPSTLPPLSNSSYTFDLSMRLGQEPLIADPLVITCKNCTTTGSMDLDLASFNVDTSSDGMNITGSATVTMHDFTAYMELETILKVSSALVFPLLTGKLPAPRKLEVPGFGYASLESGISLYVGYVLDGHAGLTSYGFTATIPDGARATVGIGSNDSISTSGFDDFNVTALPLQADTEIHGLDLWTALRPFINFKFEFDNTVAGYSIGDSISSTGVAAVYVDAPKIWLNTTDVQNVDGNCNPTNNSNDISVLDHVTRVDFSVGVDAGAYSNFSADVDGESYNFGYGPYAYNSTSLSLTRERQCLNFNGSAYTSAETALEGVGNMYRNPMGLSIIVALTLSICSAL